MASGQSTVDTLPCDTLSGLPGASYPDPDALHPKDEKEAVRAYLTDWSARRFCTHLDEPPQEYQLSAASWSELDIDPIVESYREQ